MKACTREIEYKIYTVETRALCSCPAWQSPPPYIGRCAEVKALAQWCSECHGCSLPWDLSQKAAFCSCVTSSEVKSCYTVTHHFYLVVSTFCVKGITTSKVIGTEVSLNNCILREAALFSYKTQRQNTSWTTDTKWNSSVQAQLLHSNHFSLERWERWRSGQNINPFSLLAQWTGQEFLSGYT